MQDAEVHPIAVAETGPGLDRPPYVGVGDGTEMTELTGHDRPFPSGLGSTIGELPLASSARTEVRALRITTIGRCLDDLYQTSARPGATFLGQIDPDEFTRQGPGDEHRPTVAGTPDRLTPVDHVVQANDRQGSTSSRISTRDP